MNTSVIIPVYNEAAVIGACIESLARQTIPFELIIVDDGSSDDSIQIIEKTKSEIPNLKIFKQTHLGPGAARNLGAKNATGDILVFVDSDMTFDQIFLENLITPIISSVTNGTFTTEEFVSNWENIWARCWNYNQGISNNRRVPEDYNHTAPVFRAIKKSEFEKVGGFTEGIGWTDDWSLSRKLGYEATKTDAKCYHENPGSLSEVFKQARWIGKNEFLNKNKLWTVLNLMRHNPVASLLNSFFTLFIYKTIAFVPFKLVYDAGISLGLCESFLGISGKNR